MNAGDHDRTIRRRTRASAGRRLAVAAAALGLAVLAPAAGASQGVSSHGPATEAFGWFPEWYEDADGLRLELCTSGSLCTATLEEPLPHPSEPVSFPDNFPAEAFWWGAETTLTYPGGTALLVLAQEAAFQNDVIVGGEQVSFGRVRIRATGLIAGAWYRFTHPYGTIDLQAIDKAPRVVNYTRDMGCLAAPCEDDWGHTELSDIGPRFLQWDTTESAPPEGYIGDPAIPHSVVGSTHVPEGETEPANYFRIERISGPGGSVLSTVGQTDRFTLQGKLGGPPRGAFIAGSGDLGSTLVGERSTRTVEIRNGGSGELRLGDLALAGTHAGDFVLGGGSCSGAVLNPTEKCSVSVGFQPSAAGTRTARIEVGGADDASTVNTVTLSGRGTVRPAPSGGGGQAQSPAPAPVVPAAPVAAAVPVVGQAVAGTTATAPLAVRRLTITSRVSRTRVRLRGLRLVMRLPSDTDIVRVRLYRLGRRGSQELEAQTYRVPTGNPFRMRLSDRWLRARLAPGRYRLEVTPGHGRRSLGTPTVRSLRITR
jgi:hypothetical protein